MKACPWRWTVTGMTTASSSCPAMSYGSYIAPNLSPPSLLTNPDRAPVNSQVL